MGSDVLPERRSELAKATLGALVVASGLFLIGGAAAWAAIPALCVPLLVAYRFRDPERQPPSTENVVLAPVDGVVVSVDGTTLAVQSGPLDVAVVRAPGTGTVVSLVQERMVGSKPGRFSGAELIFETPGGRVTVRQRGKRVRTLLEPGVPCAAGDRCGSLYSPARTEVGLPERDSGPWLVASGVRVQAGRTVLAALGPPLLDADGR